MLAGTDRLDKELMIGQMQGMFGVSSRAYRKTETKLETANFKVRGGMECREISASGFS